MPSFDVVKKRFFWAE